MSVAVNFTYKILHQQVLVLPRVCIKEFQRCYARGSSHTEDNDGLGERVPTRLKRRLAKQGLNLEDYQQKSPTDVLSRNTVTEEQDSIRPPTFASSDFPQSEHELQTYLKDISNSVQVPPSGTEHSDSEHFPSDTPRYQDWRRDQSRKAFRPHVSPSSTTLILFPGQGSQFLGMGNNTLAYGRANELFEEASAVLGYDLLKLCDKGPLTTLNKTVHCQPAVLVSSLAAVEKLKEQNPEAVETCVGAAGFSIGEFAALVFAGAMSFADAVEIVRVRAEAMQKASEEVPSGMMTTFLGSTSKLKTAMQAARDYCSLRSGIENPVCIVANYLYPECKVIAGHKEALDFIGKHAKTFGINRTKRLPVSGAFHTKLMTTAQKPVGDALEKITLNEPEIPVYSNVTASRYRNPTTMMDLLTKQIVSPVKWEQTMHVMYSRPQGQEFPSTYEAGPGHQLGTMLKLVNKAAYGKYTHVDV